MDQMMPEAQVPGLGGNKVVWDCISSILKTWDLKLLTFKSIEYFILQFFLEWQCGM